ncbi:hypothetical protein ACFSRY_02870 [Pontibacter locisalis]|uniref:Uncharacterized protein n=1 Tax=Pontibacter locisalis TaxID=1719035 RepID=A0ABW5IIH9_9BACT
MFSSELPKPILFHPLKHHLGYIIQYIRRNTKSTASEIRKDLLTLGTSQLDLYCGALSPQQVAQEVSTHLKEQELLQPEIFRDYLKEAEKDYRCITLSDTTDWVLRWGVIEGRYVHLHPARYAVYTIRVKAAALKTAIAVVIATQRYMASETDLSLINKVRKEWLDLAPVKSFRSTEGAGKMLELLLKHN